MGHGIYGSYATTEFFHTRVHCLHEAWKEKLRALTIEPRHESLMLGILNDVYEDQERTGRVHVFVMLGDAMWEGLPVAWATVYPATWRDPEDKVRRVNEVSIFVAEEFRGRGYSTRLLKFAKQRLKHTKRKWLGVPDTLAGEACYARVGITVATGWEEVDVLDDYDLIEDDGCVLVDGLWEAALCP